MRVSLGQARSKYAYDVRGGSRPVKALYVGNKKVYPDSSARVARLQVDLDRFNGYEQMVYFNYAMDAVGGGANWGQYVMLDCKRQYNVNRTFGTRPVARYEGNGFFAFESGTGPLAQELRLGDTAHLRMVMPPRSTPEVRGKAEFGPLLPGTRVRAWYAKQARRVCAGMTCRVDSYPSGTVFVNAMEFRQGHGKGSINVDYGYIGWYPIGDNRAYVTTESINESPYCAWLEYPDFDVTISVKVIHIEKES